MFLTHREVRKTTSIQHTFLWLQSNREHFIPSLRSLPILPQKDAINLVQSNTSQIKLLDVNYTQENFSCNHSRNQAIGHLSYAWKNPCFFRHYWLLLLLQCVSGINALASSASLKMPYHTATLMLHMHFLTSILLTNWHSPWGRSLNLLQSKVQVALLLWITWKADFLDTLNSHSWKSVPLSNWGNKLTWLRNSMQILRKLLFKKGVTPLCKPWET